MNRWNIPVWLELEVRARDQSCVYCGVEFNRGIQTRGARPSWEHVINDASIVSRENIVLCCVSCNASKGTKKLTDWLESSYCKARGVSKQSVAPIIRSVLGKVEIINGASAS